MGKINHGVVFVVSMATATILAASPLSHAWTRTIDGAACHHNGSTDLWAPWHRCAFPSDTTMSGSTATAIFADVYVDVTTNVSAQACRTNYLNTVVSCGATAGSLSYAPGSHDIQVPLWGTSGTTAWDYYYVDVMTGGTAVSMNGIGVAGP